MLKSPGKSKTEKTVQSPDGTLWSKNADKEPAVLLQLEIREHTMSRGRIKNKLLPVKYFRGELHFAGTVTWDFLPRLFPLSPRGGGPIREQK
jgi:hypothetical protein